MNTNVNAGILAMRKANAIKHTQPQGGGDSPVAKTPRKAVVLPEVTFRVAIAHVTQDGQVQAPFCAEVSAATAKRAAKAARAYARKAKLPGALGAVLAAVREDAPQACWDALAPQA